MAACVTAPQEFHLPGTARTALIACDALNARTVTKQKYHYADKSSLPQGSRPLLQCRYFSLEFSTFRKKVNEGCLTKSSWRTHCPAQIYRNVSVCSYTAMPLSCTLSFSRFTKRFHLSLGTENLLIMLERIILSLDVR